MNSEQCVIQALKELDLNRSDALFVGPVSEEQVQEVERMLNVRLTPGYRRFVLALGAGSVAGHEFMGILRDQLDVSSIPNVVFLAKCLREDGLPDKYIPVFELGDGSTTVVDSSDSSEQLWDWHTGSQLEPVGETFGEFFLQSVRTG